jgi:hypothetical protein
MKTKTNEGPLRGEAAYRAQKLAIAQSNEKACAKAQAERGARDRAHEVERRAAERRDVAVRPSQPKP